MTTKTQQQSKSSEFKEGDRVVYHPVGGALQTHARGGGRDQAHYHARIRARTQIRYRERTHSQGDRL